MTTALGLVVGLALWPLAAAADPAAPTPAPTSAAPAAPASPPPSAALAYYPPAAKAAGVEGEAKLRCERDAHVALRNCQLVSETPAGQGFGAAALALAAQSPDNPKVDIPDAAARPPIELTVRFQLHPQPQVVPDLTQMGHVVVQPQIVTRPTRAQIQAAYPARAFSDGVDGAAVIDCLADAKGALSSCQVYGERPTGYGFGAAALDLATDYQLKPRLIDGEPTGAEVQIPVQFQAQDPTAPLELGAPPAK